MSHPATSAARLHRAVKGMIQQHAPDRQWLAIGVIGADGSLRIDGDAQGYPLGTYWRLHPLDLAASAVDPVSPSLTTLAASGHTHAFALPAALGPLQPGDAVLVAWIQDQQTPVVLGTLRKAV